MNQDRLESGVPIDPRSLAKGNPEGTTSNVSYTRHLREGRLCMYFVPQSELMSSLIG